MTKFELSQLDEEADRKIRTYYAIAGVANLLTVPPVDTVLVTTQIAIMRVEMGKIYGFEMKKEYLMATAKLIIKGAGTSSAAAYVAIGIAKFVPVLNIIAMFSQPFVTALICRAAGKEY